MTVSHITTLLWILRYLLYNALLLAIRIQFIHRNSINIYIYISIPNQPTAIFQSLKLRMYIFFLISKFEHKTIYKFYNDQTMSIPNFQYFSSTPIYQQCTIYSYTKLPMNLYHVKKLITTNNHSMHQTSNHQNYRNSKSFREQLSNESNINVLQRLYHYNISSIKVYYVAN